MEKDRDSKDEAEPLHVTAAHPNRNDQLQAATANQSAVTPMDYPDSDRQTQTDIAGEEDPPGRTDHPAGSVKRPHKEG